MISPVYISCGRGPSSGVRHVLGCSAFCNLWNHIGLAQDYGSYGPCHYHGIEGTCKPTCDYDEVGMAGKAECEGLLCCYPGY